MRLMRTMRVVAGTLLGAVAGLAIVCAASALVGLYLNLDPSRSLVEVVLLALLPVVALACAVCGAALGAVAGYRIATRRERQVRVDACNSCGYSLVGNVSGRCPECGQPTGMTPPADETP